MKGKGSKIWGGTVNFQNPKHSEDLLKERGREKGSKIKTEKRVEEGVETSKHTAARLFHS